MRMFKVVRGVLGTALTWGVAWSLVGIGLRLTRFRVSPIPDAWPEIARNVLLPAAQFGFWYGAAMGTGFALLVVLMSRRTRSLAAISIPRFGLLGTLAAVGAHAWVTGGFFASAELLASALLGFGAAATTLVAARHSPRLSPPAMQGELPTI